MPASNKEMKQLLTRIVGSKEVYSKPCTVISVDEDALTCDINPLDGGPSYFDVKLTASSSSTNIQIPAVGSTVYIHFLDERTPYVTTMDTVTKSAIRASDDNGNQTASLKDALNSMVSDLIDQINKLTFTTPSGLTGAGPLETNQQALDKIKQTFADTLDKLFKS